MFLSSNLKFLRKRKKRTQEDVAAATGINRATLNGYESGLSQPNFDRLCILADYYRFSLEDIIRNDLSKLPESKLLLLQKPE